MDYWFEEKEKSRWLNTVRYIAKKTLRTLPEATWTVPEAAYQVRENDESYVWH